MFARSSKAFASLLIFGCLLALGATAPTALATPVPETTIIDGPADGERIQDLTPTFEFEGTNAESFECSYNGSSYFPCESPYTFPYGNNGETEFSVRAVNDEDVADPSPDSRAFYTAHGPQIWVDDDVLHIRGAQDTYNDVFFESASSNIELSNMSGTWFLTAGDGCSQINDHRVACPTTGLDSIEFEGGPDVDHFNPVQYAGEVTLPITMNGNGGDDLLTGGSGNDQLAGGDGSDWFVGGSGTDVVDYSDRTANVSVTPEFGYEGDDGEFAEGDHVWGDIEGAIGGAGDDYFSEGGAPAEFVGGDGNDTIELQSEGGSVDGGAGADQIDTLNGVPNAVDCGSGTDVLTADPTDDAESDCELASGPPSTRITSAPESSGTTNYADAPFKFASDATDGSFQCSLDGGSFATCAQDYVWVDVAPGEHTLAVRATSPTRGTDASADTTSFATAYRGIARSVDDAVEFTATDQAGYALQMGQSENGVVFWNNGYGVGKGCVNIVAGIKCEATSSGSISIALSDGADTVNIWSPPVGYDEISLPMEVHSGYGNDWIAGGTGDDNLSGDENDDTLSGGGGENILTGAQGNDFIDGTGGSSTADYSENALPVELSLDNEANDGVHVSGVGEMDNLYNITGVKTGEGDDQITGSADANSIESGSGDDTIDPGGGEDQVDSGAGDDLITLYDGAADHVACGDDDDTAVLDASDESEEDCEDVQKPVDTWITSGLADGTHTNATSVSFGFASYSGSDFECRLDGGTFATCTSPASYNDLDLGDHSFEARAKTASNEVDPTPARRDFVIVAKSSVSVAGSTLSFTAPTRAINTVSSGYFAPYGFYVISDMTNGITAGSGCMQASANVVFCSVTSSTQVDIDLGDEDDSINQSLGGPQPSEIDLGGGNDTFIGDGSSTTVHGGDGDDTISPGGGTDEVDAGDGNDSVSMDDSAEDAAACGEGDDQIDVDSSDEVVADCEVVRLHPETEITFGPADNSTIDERDPTVEFSTDVGDSFECKLDSGEWETCESPFSADLLENGEHSIEVRALKDGVEDRTPAMRTFTVDAADPPVLPAEADPRADAMYDIPIDAFSSVEVNIATGALLYVSRDLPSASSNGWLGFDRYFNSDGLSMEADSGLGNGWSLSLGPEVRLIVGEELELIGPGGYRARFWRDSEGDFVGPQNFAGQIDDGPSGGYTLTRWTDNDKYVFDEDGTLVAVITRNGVSHSVDGQTSSGVEMLGSVGGAPGSLSAHASAGKLTSIDSSAGEIGSVAYSGGKLAEFQTTHGTLEYGYDANGFLNEITTSDGVTASIELDAEGVVGSVSIDRPGEDSATTEFAYGDGITTVTAPDSTETPFNWDEADSSAEPIDVQRDEISALSDDLDITQAEAADHLAVETRSDGLSEAMQDQLGGGFVGITQDDETGDLVVDVTSSAAASDADEILQAFELDDRASTNVVANSSDDLEVAADAITDGVHANVAPGMAEVSIDDANNRVIVEVATSIDSGDLATVEDLVGEFSDVADIVESSQASLLGEPDDSCVGGNPPESETGCGRPMRGGMGMRLFPLLACGIAFSARKDESGSIGALTAGHCVVTSPGSINTTSDVTLTKKKTDEYNGTPKATTFQETLGKALAGGDFGDLTGGSSNVDAAFVRGSNSSSWIKGTIPPWIAFFNKDTGTRNFRYPIRSIQLVKDLTLHQLVCVAGSMRGNHCGRVAARKSSPDYWEDRFDREVHVEDMVRIHMCGGLDKGDSGSPVYSHGRAVGIFSGQGDGCRKWFTPIKKAENETGSLILTSRRRNAQTTNPRLRPRLSTALTVDAETNRHIEYDVNAMGLETRLRLETRPSPFGSTAVYEELDTPPATFATASGDATPCVEDDVQARVVATNDAGVTYGQWIDFEANCQPT